MVSQIRGRLTPWSEICDEELNNLARRQARLARNRAMLWIARSESREIRRFFSEHIRPIDSFR